MIELGYKPLLQAAVDAINGHTWTLITKPAIYKGARDNVDKTGAIVIVTHGSQSAETGIFPGQMGEHQKVLHILGGVPWEYTNSSVDLHSDLATELENIMANNRRLGGATQLKVRSVTFTRETISGPNKVESYRCVIFTVGCLDYRQP